MLILNGNSISNYYNKVKLVLLEKGIAFDEVQAMPSQDESLLARSPLGKIPFLETEHGTVSESQAIVEYLEEAYPNKPLYPADPFERAKCRELIQHLELNVELIARRLYLEAFFGGRVSDETKQEVKEKLERGLKGLSRLAAFAPYVGSDILSIADCAAWPHFSLVARATGRIYGEDLVVAHLPAVTEYLALMAERPAVRKVASDQAKAREAFHAGR